MGILSGLFNFPAMQLFYSTNIQSNHLVLEGEEARHVQVLRKQPGDKLHVVNGQGTLFTTKLDEVEKKRCILAITKRVEEYQKSAFRLGIAIAPTKNIARLEWFLEKCTEIGISDVFPVLCDHSERKHIRPDRLEKILIAAMKQSLKAYLPRLHPLVKFSDWVQSNLEWDQKMIGHCIESKKVGIPQIYQPGHDVLLLIGPEGDFSPEEVAISVQNGFEPVHLGPHRLRTETAGVVACHTIQLLNQMRDDQ